MKAKDKVKGRLLLDVVIQESLTIFKLLVKMRRCWSGGMLEMMISVWHSSEEEDNITLDLGLDIIDGIRGLKLKGDCLSSEGLYENLHR